MDESTIKKLDFQNPLEGMFDAEEAVLTHDSDWSRCSWLELMNPKNPRSSPHAVVELTGSPPALDPKTGLRIDIAQDAYTFTPLSPEQQKEIILKEFKDAKATPHILKKDKMIDMGCSLLSNLDALYDRMDKAHEYSYDKGTGGCTHCPPPPPAPEEPVNPTLTEMELKLLMLLKKRCRKTKFDFVLGNLTINGSPTGFTVDQILLFGINKVVRRIKLVFF